MLRWVWLEKCDGTEWVAATTNSEVAGRWSHPRQRGRFFVYTPL